MIWKFLKGALSLLCLSSVAFAYIPPSEYLLQRVAKRKDGFADVKIISIVSNVDGDRPGAVKFRDVTVYDYQRRRLSSQALDESGRVLFVRNREYPVKVLADQKVVVPAHSLDGPITDFLLFEAVSELSVAVMKKWGIPVRTERDLGKFKEEKERRAEEQTYVRRLENRIAWIIGNPGKLDGSGQANYQLWLEKDTFLPLRAIGNFFDSGTRDRIEFVDQAYSQGFYYPKELNLYRGDLWFLSARLDRIETTRKRTTPLDLPS